MSKDSVKTPYAIGEGHEALTQHEGGDAVPKEGVHLYHFHMSSCSQKVRMALEYKGANVQYHPVMLNLYEQHLPQYVRINPRCVVPALVVNGKITTDSKNILEHLDELLPDDEDTSRIKKLLPDDAKELKLCQQWTQLADEIPIHAATFGSIPGVQKPFPARMIMKKDHDDAIVEDLKKLIDVHQGDEYLKNAYEQKLKIIQSYVKVIQTPAQMEEACELINKTLERLNEQLEKGPFANMGGFLCSQQLCPADIEWCVLLNRLVMVGAGPKWVFNKEKLPQIGPYFQKLMSLECYKDGIAAFDSKTQLISLIASRKWNAAMGKEIVL